MIFVCQISAYVKISLLLTNIYVFVLFQLVLVINGTSQRQTNLQIICSLRSPSDHTRIENKVIRRHERAIIDLWSV